jgi:antitoxin (DNA-binding transcriptional repressor) of toxin-antitoxin stability system
MIVEISFADAEAQFFEIVDRAGRGEQFRIILDGKPVAEIVPTTRHKSEEQVAQAVEELLKMPKIEGVSGDTVLEWIREGRK